MTLTDTGPLVALVDKNDIYHAVCIAALNKFPARPLLTSWVCFTEAMYLLGKVGGYRYQSALWRWRSDGKLILHKLTVSEGDRMEELMKKYKDRPMDLADASLIAIAESQSLRYIFTIDTDFYYYRLADGSVLEVLPRINFGSSNGNP